MGSGAAVAGVVVALEASPDELDPALDEQAAAVANTATANPTTAPRRAHRLPPDPFTASP